MKIKFELKEQKFKHKIRLFLLDMTYDFTCNDHYLRELGKAFKKKKSFFIPLVDKKVLIDMSLCTFIEIYENEEV